MKTTQNINCCSQHSGPRGTASPLSTQPQPLHYTAVFELPPPFVPSLLRLLCSLVALQKDFNRCEALGRAGRKHAARTRKELVSRSRVCVCVWGGVSEVVCQCVCVCVGWGWGGV